MANKVGRPKKKTNPVKEKNPVGRPKIEINLEELERLSALNCTMPELAAYFRVPLRTLEDKYTNDPEIRATINRGREVGKLSVRRKQMQIMNDMNSPAMAIWLGKQLLGQRDKHDVITEDRGETALNEAFSVVADLVRGKKSD
tara:strand:+ start:4685 stop:5113 length:429 start_codon:yes stop_codon:yes gene_type:complete